ncbi:MAG: hypothetical protein D6705_01235 [Deltaproteobacteria bacterium]|nr:MAG: hypothetical protein D6705_01235 [Deltaproteobacteria bacterium]
MATDLDRRILQRIADMGDDGVPMGTVVDALVAEGVPAPSVERGVWNLLAAGHLVLAGFVARKVRRPDARGARSIHHTYEPLLAPAPTDDA